MNARQFSSVALAGLVGSALLARAGEAQTPAPEPKIPVREIGPVEARSKQSVTAVSMLRALPDGGFFLNDTQRRQLLRFDATLQNVTVIADTLGAPLPYSQRPPGLLPYLGDSTIIVDASTLSFVVLNPQGKVVRVMAPPRISDIQQLASANLGSNAFDAKGRLIYRNGGSGGGGGAFFGARGGGGGGGGGGAGGGAGGFGGGFGGPPGGGAPTGGAGAGQNSNGPGGRGFAPQNQPDSVPVVRADFDTRKADTLAWVKVPKSDYTMTQGADGGMHLVAKINPLPQADDWALMSDGTLAVVRVLDYHVDFFAPDGTKSVGGKLPFDWKRIEEGDKQKLVDSLKTLAKDASDKAEKQAAANPGGNRGFRISFEPVGVEKLPDYVPPIRQGTTLADHDGNLWLLPATSSLAAQLAQAAAQGMGGGRGGFGGPPGGFGGRGGAGGDPRGGVAAGGAAGGARGGPPGSATGVPAGATTGAPAGAPAAAGAPIAPQARDTSSGPTPPTFQYVYDVVNKKGELVERVKLPPNRTIAGFGPAGVIYLSAREGRNLFIEKVRRVAN